MNKKLYSLDEILSKCENVHKRGGNQWETACPVCGSNHHLYMSEKEGGKVVAYCQKCGATLPKVLEALDMKAGGGYSLPAAKPLAPADKSKAPKKENHGPVVEDYTHVYMDPDGKEAYRKTRRKYQDGHKEFLFNYQDESGNTVWGKPAGCNNLYNLDKLATAAPDTPLYIVEGEKCADSMTAAGFLATTTNTGAKNRIDKYLSDIDRKYLDKFPVKIMIPDNDKPGGEYAQAWKQEQGARILPLPDIWPECPPKGDIADYFRAGELHCKRDFEKNFKTFKWEQAKKRENGGQDGSQEERFTRFPEQPLQLWCGEWCCNERGVRKIIYLANGDIKTEMASPIPLLPTAIYENQEEGTEKIELSFFKNGKWKKTIVPRSDVANKAKIVGLADKGIEVTSGTANFLVNYISDMVNWNPYKLPKVASIGHMGWITGGEFVPYSDSVQPDFGDQFGVLLKALEPKGTLQEWYGIVIPLLESPFMRMTIAASLASVLISPLQALPFVFHLWGGTNAGKTVALMVAASIWGNPKGKLVDTMNNTINYIMEKAAILYSIPFFGDELQTIKETVGTYDKLIYQVTGQANRGRLRANGTMGRRLSWQNSFLFTGEEPITQSNSGGGAINRVIELECTEKIIQDGNGTVAAITDCYGVLGPAFIERVKQSQATTKTIFRQYEKELLDMGGTGKQAQALALMLAAYDLFQSMAPAGCPMLTIEDVKTCMKTLQEVDVTQRAYQYVCGQIAINQNKFYMDGIKPKGETWGGMADSRTVNIFKEALERILKEEGYSLRAVKQKWLDRGLLIRHKGRIFWNGSIAGVTGQVGQLALPPKDD